MGPSTFETVPSTVEGLAGDGSAAPSAAAAKGARPKRRRATTRAEEVLSRGSRGEVRARRERVVIVALLPVGRECPGRNPSHALAAGLAATSAGLFLRGFLLAGLLFAAGLFAGRRAAFFAGFFFAGRVFFATFFGAGRRAFFFAPRFFAPPSVRACSRLLRAWSFCLTSSSTCDVGTQSSSGCRSEAWKTMIR